jgi:hypothetical protein
MRSELLPLLSSTRPASTGGSISRSGNGRAGTSALRARVDAADAARIEAVTAMFARHGYAPAEADARARILYFMQLGYHALDVREPIDTRLSRVAPYLKGFTGVEPDTDAVEFHGGCGGAGAGMTRHIPHGACSARGPEWAHRAGAAAWTQGRAETGL